MINVIALLLTSAGCFGLLWLTSRTEDLELRATMNALFAIAGAGTLVIGVVMAIFAGGFQ